MHIRFAYYDQMLLLIPRCVFVWSLFRCILVFLAKYTCCTWVTHPGMEQYSKCVPHLAWYGPLYCGYMHLTFSAPPSYIVHLHITLVYTCAPTMQSFCLCSTHRDVRRISSTYNAGSIPSAHSTFSLTHQKHEDEADFEDWWNIIHNDLVDCAATLARHTISFR